MKHNSHLRSIDGHSPSPSLIAEAAHIIHKGGVVVFPTRCLYGLAADAFDPSAITKVFNLKQRPLNKPLLILIDHPSQLPPLVKCIPRSAKRIIQHFWPGDVTLVFEAADSVPQLLTAGTGKIGIRLPGHPVAAALAATSHHPITATSANLSDQPGCASVAAIPSSIIRSTDLVLDSGPLKGGAGSTVVDVSVSPPHIFREGLVTVKQITQAIKC